ncbi:hypothetical protein THERMOS_1117 [Bathymodiolus thermophilus thioautotrophic gill symbiont]|uniref:Uncharacterized protein n=2 Tax=Bathymodiolus thermophilus thioautotrophic gill symbiont TaxID=2360 RepID=A0A8H8XDG5_9GAMM|nr:hypothetical protein THERMOS_1117 [Bathymodiolus thermophilus thioautotrophic gill symbiont]
MLFSKINQAIWRQHLGDYKHRDLCINMNNHQESSFYPLGNFLNPALALLGQGLRKSPSGQKLNFANHSYLCKGLLKNCFVKK